MSLSPEAAEIYYLQEEVEKLTKALGNVNKLVNDIYFEANRNCLSLYISDGEREIKNKIIGMIDEVCK